MRIIPVNTIGLKIQNKNRVSFSFGVKEEGLLLSNFKTYSSIYDTQSSKSSKLRLLDTIDKFAEEIMSSGEKSDESAKIVTDFYKGLASNTEEDQVIRRDAFSMLGYTGLRTDMDRRLGLILFMRKNIDEDKSLDDNTKQTINNMISLLETKNYIQTPTAKLFS